MHDTTYDIFIVASLSVVDRWSLWCCLTYNDFVTIERQGTKDIACEDRANLKACYDWSSGRLVL
jgi:hypothetical protein